MAIAFIGIGSNIGDRQKNIDAATKMLEQKCKILKKSSIYETEPIGCKNQGDFLNCAVKIETDLKPLELLGFLQSIEKNLGRTKTIKNGPRTIDLDILFYDSLITKDRLIIPHPRLHERLFVLEPMNEIEPNFVHPVLKEKISALMDKCPKQKIRDLKKYPNSSQNSN